MITYPRKSERKCSFFVVNFGWEDKKHILKYVECLQNWLNPLVHIKKKKKEKERERSKETEREKER